MTDNAARHLTRLNRREPLQRGASRGSAMRSPFVAGRLASITLAAVTVLAPVPAVARRPAAAPSPSPVVGEAPVPPTPRPPEIQVQPLPAAPAAGKGRLALTIAGNRRWCTFPDDRLVRPTPKPGTPIKRNEVFTFGYKMTLSAIKRGQADTPIMLYESPLFRTATWMPASKIGMGRKKAAHGPMVMPEGGDTRANSREEAISPGTLVPLWSDQNRCVVLPGGMDFDLDPGTYDVYLAFDLMNREGGYVHRSTGFLTDVSIEAAQRTRLDGLVNMQSGADRQVELQSATIEPAQAPGTPPPPHAP